MRVAVDIDGTICEFRGPGETYADVRPKAGAVERLTSLKAAGHYIILLTARHMRSCDGNVGLVIKREGKTLLDWLEQHGIPYDELWFGKPHADIYIDDNGFRFTSWDEIAWDGANLPRSAEARIRAAAASPGDDAQ